MAKIELKGREYPLLFDMNLQEKIQERYGDVRNITAQVLRYSEARWLLAEAISEGFRYEESFGGAPHREIALEQVGMITSFSDFSSGKIAGALLDALNESLEDGKKKLTLTDLEQAGLKILQETAQKSTSAE